MQGRTHFRRIAMLGALLLCGCTSIQEYVHNGFKVGPNYKRPPAPVADHWIDAADKRVRSEETDAARWWTSFNDPILSEFVQTAYRQNLSLREAGFRVLQSRAELGIAVLTKSSANTDNQRQHARATIVSTNVANRVATPTRWFGQWDYGFNVGWELDFWGRFRRAIESAEDSLDASVEQYDDVLVTLIGDVATTYVQYRVTQQQITYARETLRLQRESARNRRRQVQRWTGQQDPRRRSGTKRRRDHQKRLIEQLEIPLRPGGEPCKDAFLWECRPKR